jgi:dienelactone hydrolase
MTLVTRSRILILLLLALGPSPTLAQGAPEKFSLPREHRGKQVTISGQLYLPTGAAKVPAIVVHHGSGGVAEREGTYAREMVKLGVAALVLDSFKGRGVADTVQDQSAVTNDEMLDDAFGALKALAGHPRIDGQRIGIVGFSKGGTVALLAAHERRAARALPAALRFALHVPFYPSCSTQHYRPKSTGAPIYLLLGGADTYVGVAPCQEYAASLKAEGARLEVTVYPGAPHGFDSGSAYKIAKGENYSRCIFAEQSDGTWKERISGATTTDAKGQRNEAGLKQALATCRTLGVSGGPNAAAKTKAMAELKGYVQRHLLDGR